jgi:hypothetical protein
MTMSSTPHTLSVLLFSIGTSFSEGENLKLNIVSAAYGLSDVTARAQQLVTADEEFNEMASNEVWGEGFPGKDKTLVVVYTYSNMYMVDIAISGQRMHFIVSPPLRILGAAYGVENVSEKVKALVKNRSLSVTVKNSTFGDGWRGKKKTLVVVYQYGDETPTVATAIEDEQLEFLYKKSPEFSSSENPSTLTILGAAYGPRNVTQMVQSHVKGTTLEVTANNDTFGTDPWKRHKKTLVVVYRYECNEPEVRVIKERRSIYLQQ